MDPFLFQEKYWCNNLNKIVVVGEQDKKWIDANNMKNNKSSNVFYLHHPLLKNDLIDIANNEYDNFSVKEKRFIFSGDLSRIYIGTYFTQLIDYMKEWDITPEIVIVGKKNRWIYDIFLQLTILKITYLEWVEDYSDICQIGRDIHCVPLKAGAGTKNRILTAVANGVDVITTEIGVENVCVKDVSNVFVVKSCKEFAEVMYSQYKKKITDYNNIILRERLNFREKVQKEFARDIKRIFL